MWKFVGNIKFNIDSILKQIEQDVKDGSPELDKMRYVFTTEDSIIYMLTPFDLVDLNPKPIIKSLSLYSSI